MTNDELDRLIAEKVMGWKASQTEGWPTGDYYPDYYGGGPHRITGTTPDSINTIKWSPSTNIAQAWEVIEKLTGVMRMDVLIGKTTAGSWRCNFNNLCMNTVQDTAPMAICIAALKAIRC